ncbi:transposase [Pelomonas sp. CA6]|uniref:transposase n=1 Tax=Pelomonas sp. CA6 TaxID=2907999 RepID=UPI001F4BEFF1|nr:transposase [Pelomonas sp. CA6]MCH7344557.1 transposase [Pelomonas sp. CA6]
MARPLRIEIPGAVYHVSSHGGPPVFADDTDRATFLELLAQAMQRFDAQVLAYALARDHYELLVFTRQANLSRLMRHLNGVYTQACNRRRGRGGHLFHGRFRAVMVDRLQLLLDVCRYVDLGGVRAGLARSPEDWPWSSYAAHAGLSPAPEWLDVEGLWSFINEGPPRSAAERRRAAQRYRRLVQAEPGLDIWQHLRQQVYLGDEAFVARVRGGTPSRRRAAAPMRPRPWRDWLRECQGQRELALYRAHTEGGLTMSALAQELGLSVSRVSRLIAGYERNRGTAAA